MGFMTRASIGDVAAVGQILAMSPPSLGSLSRAIRYCPTMYLSIGLAKSNIKIITST